MCAAFCRFSGFLILLAALFFLAFRGADDAFIQRLLSQFERYNQQVPTEKVYLQTDRSVYLAGETIWLKGYLFSGNTHTADTVSRVLYVDLIDPVAKRISLRLQLRATNSYAPSQLALPDSMPTGTFLLRAYTNYMRNFSDAYFFTKTITILRSGGATGTYSPQHKPTVDLQFLPEGGQMVEGIDGRVAFKAVNEAGQGQTVQGFVMNNQKDTVIGLTSAHLGMGFFMLKPEPGQTYTAFLLKPDGTYAPYPLPVAQLQGVVMQVDNVSNKENIRVYVRHNKASNDPAALMTLVAQTRGRMVQVAKVPVAKKAASVTLSRAEFPEGIAQLTLFDEANKLVCERLLFVNKNEHINLALTTSKSTYQNRERVDLTITATDQIGKPVAANLALSAVDARLSPDLDSAGTTIQSHLLLESDLTGTIEDPGYYFDSANVNRVQHLDLLLMTQGWRRFAWADVMAETIPALKYPVEPGLSLTGQVLRPNQKAVAEKVRLTFMLVRRDSSKNFLVGETDDTGNYGAYGLDFMDTTTVMIQGMKGKANRDLVITLDQLLRPTVTLTKIPYNPVEFRRDELTEFIKRTNEYLEIERQIRQNGEVLLQTVTVKAKRTEERDSRVIYGTPDASIKFSDLNTGGMLTVLDVIQGRLAGVQVMGQGFNAVVQIRGAANFSGVVEPLFVLDGMTVDKQIAINIPVQDVERVDVLKGASAAIYGSRAGGGVISILTKRGGPNYDMSKVAAPGTLIAKLPGYAPVREFYAPRYDLKRNEQQVGGRSALLNRPDYRATIYWQPLIQTNADGKATVSFFTSDNKTDIRLRAEGATTTGMPGVGRALLRVN